MQLIEYMKDWDDVNCELFSDFKRKTFEQRKRAIELYSKGLSVKEIYNTTGIRPNKISGYIDKCITINPDTGRQYGFEALIPNNKIAKSKRSGFDSTAKRRGSFSHLLAEFPELQQFILGVYVGDPKITLEKNMSVSHMHLLFLEKCRKVKLSDADYPFNTTDKAKRSFYKYVENLGKMSDLATVRENKNASKKFNSTGTGNQIRNRPLVPFSVIQIDGHKIDMLYSVQVTNNQGETVNMVATRMWLIAVIDVSTRVVLGYSLTTNENYNQFDVLAALRNSIMPKTKLNFTLNGIEYPENGGFPSLAIPETHWALPNIIMLDNAKSHLANNVQNKLIEDLFCTLNFGSVATPETRGIVERMFGRLEKDGYHRIVSTTGSNPNDNKRKDPEKNAEKYVISYDDIVQLTEYFIAIYNTSPHSSLNNETPLECMHRRIKQDGMKPCIADAEMKKKIYELTNVTEIRIIRGNKKSGRRPYITFKGVEYRNDILSQSVGLIGKKLIIDVNPDDIRTIKGYFEDGTYIGLLTAVGEWGRRKHSLDTRKDAIKLSNSNKIKNNTKSRVDLTDFEAELRERAKNERRARTKAARIQRDANTIDNSGYKREPEKTTVKNGNSKISTNENQTYTDEEIEAIMNAESFESAYDEGLL